MAVKAIRHSSILDSNLKVTKGPCFKHLWSFYNSDDSIAEMLIMNRNRDTCRCRSLEVCCVGFQGLLDIASPNGKKAHKTSRAQILVLNISRCLPVIDIQHHINAFNLVFDWFANLFVPFICGGYGGDL